MKSYGYLVAAGSPASCYISIDRDRIFDLIRPLLAAIEVDEKWYCEHNPDVQAAINQGNIKTGKDHYTKAGFFENRQPHYIKVSEDWYLKEYGDVTAAIADGRLESGQQHFIENGFSEGRLPYPDWTLNEPKQRRPETSGHRRKYRLSQNALSDLLVRT